MTGNNYGLGNKFNLTEEQKEKIRNAAKGNKNCMGHKNTLGYHHTEKTRNKMSSSRMGNKNGLGNKNHFNKPHKISVKEKISNALKGNKNASGCRSDEAKNNIGMGCKKYWMKKKFMEALLVA